MKKNILIPAALLSALAFFACDRTDNETDKAEEVNVESSANEINSKMPDPKVSPDSIEWIAVEAREEYTAPELVETYPDANFDFTFRANYSLLLPKATDGSESPFLDTITRKMMSRLDTLKFTKTESPEALLKQYVRRQLESHKAWMSKSDIKEYGSPYTFIEDYALTDSMVYCQKGIVSIISRWSAFTGGAHANWGDTGWVFDLNREIILSEKALFKEGSAFEIRRLLREALMKEHGVTDAKVLSDSLHIDMGYVVMNGNFYFDGDGITYIYQPYEIAPYAFGQSLIRLPFAALAPYLREEYATFAE